MSKVSQSAEAAQLALTQLIASGKKVSQYAVEKKAGLANGALNYKHPKYEEIKQRIHDAKSSLNKESTVSNDNLRQVCNHERHLKKVYREKLKLANNRLKALEGEKLELQYQLFHMQKYLAELEKLGVADSNILEFRLPDLD
ncbi:hypothetical protein CAG58_09715 [Vibrio sp. V31_P5A7T61]|uniref:Transposase n=2 Tax=Unclassified Bacteria TaxID=49928 RepID=A0AAU6UP87_UNCXX|nr:MULTISPECIES: hypothetical protein [unclassified Vibrio]EKO3643020.1 hypothetical protein [Vibrio metschnikovii]EKO3791010.1 hypothetical protein [Vibrio metschnikovii]NAW62218.1 hypothetical protein [Vibrio sp. V31_P5A7T61]NAX02337.1 hypothetical protein [Vibrio sp. V34_P3A8T189]NAX09181.1 hypothetical protein [Vibrio sp. V40_P2S30T141]